MSSCISSPSISPYTTVVLSYRAVVKLKIRADGSSINFPDSVFVCSLSGFGNFFITRVLKLPFETQLTVNAEDFKKLRINNSGLSNFYPNSVFTVIKNKESNDRTIIRLEKSTNN